MKSQCVSSGRYLGIEMVSFTFHFVPLLLDGFLDSKGTSPFELKTLQIIYVRNIHLTYENLLRNDVKSLRS